MKTLIRWFAQPDERPVAHQAWSGLKITLYFLAGFACITSYLMGISYAAGGAPFKAILYLSPSLSILYFTAHRWVKIFPGFLLLGALAGVQSDRNFDGPDIIIITIALAASTFLSLQLLHRKLNWIDRFATVIAVTCPLVGATLGGRAELAGCLAMTGALAIPWLFQRATGAQSGRGNNAGQPRNSARSG